MATLSKKEHKECVFDEVSGRRLFSLILIDNLGFPYIVMKSYKYLAINLIFQMILYLLHTVATVIIFCIGCATR